MQFNKIKLKDIADINMGQSPSGSSYNNNGRGIPFLQGNKTFGFLYPTIDTWTTEPKKIGKKNSVLMSVRAPVGDLNIANKDICIGRGLCSIEMKNGNNQYLYYLLKNSIKKIKMKSTGTVFDSINRKELENIEILDFNKSQQKKISKVLFDIDKKIELNIQTNDNLLNLAKLKFEEWLTSCDEKLFIKDMADEILDYNKNNNEKVKLLNSSDVTLGKFPKIDFVDNKDLKGHFKKRFQKYDVLYSQIRPRNMHFGYALMDDYNDYIASTRLMVVRNKKDIVSSSVLYFYLTSREAIEDFTLKTESRSGTFPQGNYEDLSSFKVKYSSDQDEITKLLDLTLEKIYFNNKQNETLEQLRDTLLPKLMNGEIDLDKIEI